MSVGGRGGNSLIKKLEASLIVDLATIGVLLFNAYVIYSSTNSYRLDLMSPGSSMEALALQLTAGAILLYGLEALKDKVKGGGSSLYG